MSMRLTVLRFWRVWLKKSLSAQVEPSLVWCNIHNGGDKCFSGQGFPCDAKLSEVLSSAKCTGILQADSMYDAIDPPSGRYPVLKLYCRPRPRQKHHLKRLEKLRRMCLVTIKRMLICSFYPYIGLISISFTAMEVLQCTTWQTLSPDGALPIQTRLCSIGTCNVLIVMLLPAIDCLFVKHALITSSRYPSARTIV